MMRVSPLAFVIDTGPLLLHAFSRFANGRYLREVSANIPSPDIIRVADALGRLIIRSRRIVTTPLVLVEFQTVALSRTGLDDQRLRELFQDYTGILSLFEEYYTGKDNLLQLKFQLDTWHLCLTDTSLLHASRELGIPILTLDGRLRQDAQRYGASARHFYYDLYLGVV